MSDFSITVLESFPPELFMQIFGFLNGYDIYKAFYGINHRLSALVLATAIKYIDLCEKTINESRKMLSDIDCSKIFTLKFSNKYNNEQIDQLLDNDCFPLANFNHIRSLTFDSIGIFTFYSIFRQHFHLLHLKSFIIRFRSGQCKEKLCDMCKYVFNDVPLRFQSLKLLEITVNDDKSIINDKPYLSTSFPFSTEVCSSLKHLHTNNIRIKDIETTLSLFPHLHTLNTTVKLNSSIFNYPPLLNLSSCILVVLSSHSGSLFSLLKQCCNLKRTILYIIPADDGALDREQWEHLIENYLPKLKQFQLHMWVNHILLDEVQTLCTNSFLQNKFWLDRKTQVTVENIQPNTDDDLEVEVIIEFTT